MSRLNQSRRQNVGRVSKPSNNNRVTTQQHSRFMSTVQSQAFSQNMRGSGAAEAIDKVRGVIDTAKKGFEIAKTAKNVVGAIIGAATGEIGTNLRNRLPDSDGNARPGFAGEKHAILRLPNGKNGMANWMGPGTQVVKRLKRGDPPRSAADKVAKRHDIDYTLSKEAGSRDAQLALNRVADTRMVNALKVIKAKRGDAGRNIAMGMRLIQAKNLGEDLGIIDKGQFAGPLAKGTPADKSLLENARAKLIQEGSGPPVLPGDKLRKKLLTKMLREKRMKALGDRRNTSPLTGSGSLVIAGTSSGTSRSKTLPGMKDHELKGGFIFATIAAIIASISAAASAAAATTIVGGVTVGALAGAAATGAATAAGAAIVNKLVGDGAKDQLKKVVKGVKISLADFSKTDKKAILLGFKTYRANPTGVALIKLGKKIAPLARVAINKKIKTDLKEHTGSGLSLAGAGPVKTFDKAFVSHFVKSASPKA